MPGSAFPQTCPQGPQEGPWRFLTALEVGTMLKAVKASRIDARRSGGHLKAEIDTWRELAAQK